MKTLKTYGDVRAAMRRGDVVERMGFDSRWRIYSVDINVKCKDYEKLGARYRIKTTVPVTLYKIY